MTAVEVGRWPGLVIGSALCFALAAGGLVTHPAAFAGGGPEASPTSVVLMLGLLVAYAAVGALLGRASGPGVSAALGEGTRFGLVIGGVWVVSHTVEVFTAAPGAVSLLFFGLVFLLFGGAGFAGARRTGRVGPGVLSAVWAAMSSSLILVVYGFLLAYLFMGRMAAIEAPDFARSGMHDPAAFTIANTIFSAGSHLLETPIIAAVLGLIGSVVGRASRRHQSSAPSAPSAAAD